MDNEANFKINFTDIFLNNYKNKKKSEKKDKYEKKKTKKIIDKNTEHKIKSKIMSPSKTYSKVQINLRKTHSKKHKYKRGAQGPQGPRGAQGIQGASNLTEIFTDQTMYNLPTGTNNQVLEIIKTSPNTWSRFNNFGLDGLIKCVVQFKNKLYVGGSFHKTIDGSVENLNYIAMYDPIENNGNGQWFSLSDNGLNGEVFCMCAVGDILYIGGNFSGTYSNIITSKSIIKYDGSEWYSFVEGGLNNDESPSVNSIINVDILDTSTLYIGGIFDKTQSNSITSGINSIIKYNISGNQWVSINSTFSSSDVINSLCYDNDLLYAGGEFINGDAHNIINYNGTAWFALSNGGLNGQVLCMIMHENNLYVGGFFNYTADLSTELNHIACYNNDSWESLTNNGLNNLVRTIVHVPNTNLLCIGGDFSSTCDFTVTNLNLIVEYNGITKSWSSLTNQGIFNESRNGIYSNVRAILPIPIPILNIIYIGGENIHKSADSLFENFNNIVQYNTCNILTINYNNLTLTTLGLFGESVKLFYINGTWNILL